jgi:hypothetical protein
MNCSRCGAPFYTEAGTLASKPNCHCYEIPPEIEVSEKPKVSQEARAIISAIILHAECVRNPNLSSSIYSESVRMADRLIEEIEK